MLIYKPFVLFGLTVLYNYDILLAEYHDEEGKNFMKKIISFVLAMSMMLSLMISVRADDEVTVMVDGEKVEFDVLPIIENDRTLVPMRAIFEALGKTISWNDETKTAIAEDSSITVAFKIGTDEIIKTDKKSDSETETIKIDVSAKIVNDRTIVPLRAISEAFGNVVDWDGETRTVTVTSVEKNTPIEAIEPVDTEGTYLQKLMANLPKDKNSVISPFGLKTAMMMAANGAEGATQKEILDAFDVEDIDKFNEYMSSKMNSYVMDINDYYFLDDEDEIQDEYAIVMPELKIANSIWFNKDFYNNPDAGFSKNFKDVISKYYDGVANTVTNDTYASDVNNWVNEMTNGRISELMNEDAENQTLISIINTIYLKTRWILEFSKSDTKEDIFTDIDGNKVTTDFMNDETTYSYYEDGDTKMVKLKCHDDVCMWFVLGDDSDFINKSKKAEIRRVQLSIPKFKISYSADYAKVLNGMGVVKLFESNNSDLKPMLFNVPPIGKIDSVIQKTILEIDERGIEATAVTEIDWVGLARPDETAVFKADRPFSYYITDDAKDGEVLFAGRVVKMD